MVHLNPIAHMKPNQASLAIMFVSKHKRAIDYSLNIRSVKALVLAPLLLFAYQLAHSQASNNTCATATILTINPNCNSTNGDLYLANSTSPTGSCGNRADVWYQFTVPANTSSITINVSLTSNPSSLTVNNTFIELFNTANCTLNGNAVQGCQGIQTPRTYSVTAGATYYFRIYTSASPTTNPTRWGFNVCVTSNDNCNTSATITPGTSLNGNLFNASTSTGVPVGCATGTPDDDVWFRFVAISNHATITLSNFGGNISSTNGMIQVFNGSAGCGSLTSIACGRGNVNIPSGLNIGTTYFIRVYTSGAGQAGFTGPGSYFQISVTPSAPVIVSSGRMKEMYQQTILSSINTLDNPWEVTYGPDNKLWITESKGYRLYRMDPVTGNRDTVLDISQGSSFLPIADQIFNMQFSISTNNPQGGFAGMALHPKFLDATDPKNFVYVSYVHTFIVNNNPNGVYYTNRLVRFTYSTSTGKLGSPVSLCDTLPGSNDHNSQRMIIVPVSGTPYLFYASGDMGSGQFNNRLRPMKAGLVDSYEGKILRFNLEADTDPGTLDQWIPNDNPFNVTLGVQTAVWALGIRNNQGFAYDTALNKLYGSSHGPYSDDEINIIEPGRHYGHPYVIGFKADNNYNGSSAGAPLTTAGGVSTCPIIVNENNNADSIGASYKDPLFSAYAANQATVNNIWSTNPSNGGWPSEGWSGLDLYTHTLVPGWKKSLVSASLKWGRLVRTRLNATGDSVIATGTTDTVSYFGSVNRFRDLAIHPGGKDLFVIMDRSSTTSGPSAANPVVPGCPGCVQKYSFIGYADQLGKSTIPAEIDITAGSANSCVTGTTININSSNNNYWVPITGPDGNIMAEIFANGQSLGEINSSFYKNVGAIRNKGNARYMDRNITITPQNQPSSNVKIRLYFSKAEYDALDLNPFSQVSTLTDVKIHKNNDPCLGTISGSTTIINPTFSEVHGANGYMLQADINSFSSFYFGAANLTLPLNLITFRGVYKSGSSYLNWETKNEINSDYFIVERSTNGNIFEEIGKINAKGKVNQNTNYELIDAKASLLGVSNIYYRLKIVDRDGSYSYSSIVLITVPDILITIINIFPNPTRGEATVSISSPKEQKIQWQLVDQAGRVINNQSTVVRKGSNNIPVSLQSLPSGTYFIKVNGPFVSTIQKLQKM